MAQYSSFEGTITFRSGEDFMRALEIIRGRLNPSLLTCPIFIQSKKLEFPKHLSTNDTGRNLASSIVNLLDVEFDGVLLGDSEDSMECYIAKEGRLKVIDLQRYAKENQLGVLNQEMDDYQDKVREVIQEWYEDNEGAL
jgi:hypothetical protein